MARKRNQARWYPAERKGERMATVAAGVDFLAEPTAKGWKLSAWDEKTGKMEVVPHPFASFADLREHVDLEAPSYARRNKKAREIQQGRTGNEEGPEANQGVPPEEKQRRRARGERAEKAKQSRRKARVENPLGTLERLPKGKRMWEAVYQSAQERGFSQERSAQQAWGAVKAAGYTQDASGTWQAPRAENDARPFGGQEIAARVRNETPSPGAERRENRKVALPRPGDAPLVIESYGRRMTVQPHERGEWLVASGPRRRIGGKAETLDDIEYFETYGMMTPSTPGVWQNPRRKAGEKRTWLDEGAEPGDLLIFHEPSKYDDDFSKGYYDVMRVTRSGDVSGELCTGRSEQEALACAQERARVAGWQSVVVFRVTANNELRQVGHAGEAHQRMKHYV